MHHFLAFAVLFTACVHHAAPIPTVAAADAPSAPDLGPAPALRLPDLRGTSHDLASMRTAPGKAGRPVLLHFGASW